MINEPKPVSALPEGAATPHDRRSGNDRRSEANTVRSEAGPERRSFRDRRADGAAEPQLNPTGNQLESAVLGTGAGNQSEDAEVVTALTAIVREWRRKEADVITDQRRQINALRGELTAVIAERDEVRDLADHIAADLMEAESTLGGYAVQITELKHHVDAATAERDALKVELAGCGSALRSEVEARLDAEDRTRRAEAERDKWVDNFNRSEQFQSGPAKLAEIAEAQLAALVERLRQLQTHDYPPVGYTGSFYKADDVLAELQQGGQL